MNRRWMVTGLLVLAIAIIHWTLPRDDLSYHIAHVAMRKAFLLPVVLAAVWFNLPGALVTALAVSLLYAPHIVWQWSGQTHENINQVGEIVTLWIVAIVCGRLVSVEKKAARNEADANEGALLALIGTLDARKQKRKYHAMRVYTYAARLARELQLKPEDIEILAQASVLHDLGMIAVSDHILFKLGALTDEEWESIRKHPTIGHRIVQRVPSLRKAAEIVHAHHERFNGTGYPRQLVGTEIPFLARVFSVADVFDAITTNRRYGRALSFDEAREVIANESASQFDPTIVKAFLQVSVTEWQQILRQLEMRMVELKSENIRVADALEAEIEW